MVFPDALGRPEITPNMDNFINIPTRTISTKSRPVSVFSMHYQEEDLVYSLRWFLVFGRILGVVPYDGVLKGNVESLEFRWKSLGTLTNCACCFLMSLNIVIGTIGFFLSKGRTAQELVVNSHYLIFFCVGLLTYLFLLLKAQEFLRILKEWKYLRMHFTLKDKHLWRDVNAIVIFIYSSIILENTTWHIKNFHLAANHHSGEYNKSEHNISIGEYFYEKSEPQLSAVIPYHPVMLGFLLITNKFSLYSGHFGDVLLIVISRAMYYKFKLLVQKAKEELYQLGQEKEPRIWKNLLEDYSTLLNLLSSFETFLSPLVFLSFSQNIYSICLHLNMALQAEEETTIVAASIYANWAFIHIICRFYMVALSVAKINEHALSIRGILRKCPNEAYSPEIARFENQLAMSEIGLKGFGCFNVTKPFMLKILSVIFTVEIVLLQSSVKSAS